MSYFEKIIENFLETNKDADFKKILSIAGRMLIFPDIDVPEEVSYPIKKWYQNIIDEIDIRKIFINEKELRKYKKELRSLMTPIFGGEYKKI